MALFSRTFPFNLMLGELYPPGELFTIVMLNSKPYEMAMESLE